MARRSEHWLCRIHSMHSAGPWPISIQLLYFHLILWIRNQSMMRWLLSKNNTEHSSIDLILKIVEKIKHHTKKYTGFQYGTALAISGNWMFNAIFKCCFCVGVIAKCRTHAFYCTIHRLVGCMQPLNKAQFLFFIK